MKMFDRHKNWNRNKKYISTKTSRSEEKKSNLIFLGFKREVAVNETQICFSFFYEENTRIWFIILLLLNRNNI